MSLGHGICRVLLVDKSAAADLVIPCEQGFVAQLNEGPHLTKRPKEFEVDKVQQPFDENKFNFTKVGQDQVLFQFEASEDAECDVAANTKAHEAVQVLKAVTHFSVVNHNFSIR
ncbi:hypothetical protein CTI12_AA300890 [Artemisia annua]|uniref:GDPGP1-like N-terminal domain-containing protein n=1 Tax=Artemisia annua TaxID=35608 RepID=A0A2U1N6S7_ARTAN|nr:hypothetical protein CTI12_AA300890 [Artemisia annua]